MATVDGAPIPEEAQAKVHGIFEHDAAKGGVPVHTFSPDASSQEKAAAAGKGEQKLGLENNEAKAGAQGMCYPSPTSTNIRLAQPTLALNSSPFTSPQRSKSTPAQAMCFPQ